MDDETRRQWELRFPDAPPGFIEMNHCVIFSHEIRKRMTGPSDWLRDPATLLSDLRLLEDWRAEIIDDNAASDDEEYSCTIYRKDKSILFTLLKVTVQEMIVNLRAAKVGSSLPVCPDKLETFARTLEAVHIGSDDPQSVYDLWRILNQEIRTMEAFCRLHCPKILPAGVLYSMQDLCDMIGVEATKTVQNYLVAAGLPTCGRGQSKTFRLDREQAIEFLTQVYSTPTTSTHRDEASKSLNRLNSMN
jgi:hypothetical protein